MATATNQRWDRVAKGNFYAPPVGRGATAEGGKHDGSRGLRISRGLICLTLLNTNQRGGEKISLCRLGVPKGAIFSSQC